MRAWAGIAALLVVCVAPAGCREREPIAPTEEVTHAPQTPYLTRRSAHATGLRERGPAPAGFTATPPPPGVRLVHYRSGELDLAAWYSAPGWGGGSSPGLVYFHGDFAFGPDDFEIVRRFVDAGYAVLTPMLRGENGNPGDFELLWGEVDDGRAAVEWLAAQPEVDRQRVFAFGHSIGGGLAVMLSLYPELPLRATGSCGGIYVPETFARWAGSEGNAKLIRFDTEDPDETTLRVLGPNIEWMAHPHMAYVGEQDPWFVDNAQALERRAWELGKPFELFRVPGDHMSSLDPALDAFLGAISPG